MENNLTKMISYSGEDVEFIVSDDCSKDDILGICTACHDNRIHYYKTDGNCGHDLNILNAIEHASGEYVLILRSRDTLLPEQIPEMIRVLKSNPSAGYFVFSAIDEDDNIKLSFNDSLYHMGVPAIRTESKLFVHPSGNIYKKSLVETALLREYITSSFSHKYGFVVHELIRMHLSTVSDFYTSSIIAWVYQNSERQKDAAVNSLHTGKSVYDPSLGYERFTCEYRFVNQELSDVKKYSFLLSLNVIKRYFKRITYDFIAINKNSDMQAHYGFQEMPYSFKEERKKFLIVAKQLVTDLGAYRKLLQLIYLYLFSWKLATYYPIRDTIINHLFSTKEQNIISNWVRRI